MQIRGILRNNINNRAKCESIEKVKRHSSYGSRIRSTMIFGKKRKKSTSTSKVPIVKPNLSLSLSIVEVIESQVYTMGNETPMTAQIQITKAKLSCINFLGSENFCSGLRFLQTLIMMQWFVIFTSSSRIFVFLLVGLANHLTRTLLH